MKSANKFSHIYLHRDPVDFRKSINGLGAIAQEEIKLDPYNSALFLFTSGRRKRIKRIILSRHSETEALYDLVSKLRSKQYGQSSEKVSNEQLGMFDEVESEALIVESEDTDETITVPSHERKRGKRLKLPDSLPRIDVVIDIENKFCPKYGEELDVLCETRRSDSESKYLQLS